MNLHQTITDQDMLDALEKHNCYLMRAAKTLGISVSALKSRLHHNRYPLAQAYWRQYRHERGRPKKVIGQILLPEIPSPPRSETPLPQPASSPATSTDVRTDAQS
jgi:hypothetical protein